MLFRLGAAFSTLSRRFIPEPYVFALFLTLLALVMTVLGQFQLGKSWSGVGELLVFWQKTGLWQYLEFGMQMVLVLVTGHAVATSRPVFKVLKGMANWPRTPTSAIIMTAALSILAGIVHWGLALIVGAYFAREVAHRFQARGELLHYPLCGAAAYLGLMIWHGGLSGSAPLVMNTPGHFLSDQVALIPITTTVLSSMNLILLLVLLVGLPLVVGMMHPRRADQVDMSAVPPLEPEMEAEEKGSSLAQWLERSSTLSMLVAIIGLASLFIAGWGRFRLSLNSLNFIFLFLGIILHRTPRSYLNSIQAGVKSASGIIILFPFYAGIYGLLAYDDMIRQWIQWAVTSANETVFIVGTFLSAGLLNLFVPSGGGQWGIQGPLAIAGAEQLGIPFSKITMAVAYGDEWTNMLQPFWALPILQITGLKAREIVGYTSLIMLLSLPAYLLVLILF